MIEYNILYYEGNLHIIDVSQSVDLDHPLSLDLLYGDCIHVSDFFGKNGVEIVSLSDLFDLIVDSSIPDESVGCYLEESGIPRFTRGQSSSGLWYIPTDQNLVPKHLEILDTSYICTKHTNNLGTESGTDENEVVDDDDSSDSEGVKSYDTMKEGTRKTLPADKKAARKENKKKVKEEKRQARRTKTAKYVKKKKNKLPKNIKTM